MNLDELNVFEGLGGPSSEETNDNDFNDLDCPVFGILESMYFEPHPYGVTMSISGTEKILEGIGYKIVTKDGIKYALLGDEKLSRSKEKRQMQELLHVYKRLAEELAIKKFIKDWKDVHSSTGNTGEA